MKRVYLVRKGVSLDNIRDFITKIDEYSGRRFKAVFFEDARDRAIDIIQVETLVRSCKSAILLLGGDDTSMSPYLDDEIRFALRFGLRKFVLTLDEERYPAGEAKGVPTTWRSYTSTVFKASDQNIPLAIDGIGLEAKFPWRVE